MERYSDSDRCKRNRIGRSCRGYRIEPVAGGYIYRSVWIIISSRICEQAAEKVLEEKQAEGVSVLLMNPQNGRNPWLMVNVPEFNLNDTLSN